MKFLEKNVGKEDKIVRVVLGIVAFISSAFIQTPWSYLAIIIGIIFIITAILGTCGLYTLLGINTNKKQEKKSNKKEKAKKKKRN